MRATNGQDYIVQQPTGADIIGEKIRIDQIYGVSFACKWTGAPTGLIHVQGSNSGNSGEWESVDSQDPALVPNFKLFNIDGIHYRYIRIFFNRTTGAGLMDVHYHAKGS